LPRYITFKKTLLAVVGTDIRAVEQFTTTHVNRALAAAQYTIGQCRTLQEAADKVASCYSPHFLDPKTLNTKLAACCGRVQGARSSHVHFWSPLISLFDATDREIVVRHFAIDPRLKVKSPVNGIVTFTFLHPVAALVELLLDNSINSDDNLMYKADNTAKSWGEINTGTVVYYYAEAGGGVDLVVADQCFLNVSADRWINAEIEIGAN
jgi:hypothetical protein